MWELGKIWAAIKKKGIQKKSGRLRTGCKEQGGKMWMISDEYFLERENPGVQNGWGKTHRTL